MTIPKHIREAMHMLGLKQSDVVIDRNKHYRLTVGGKTITCSTSPTNPTIAARQIAKQLSQIMGAV